MTQTQRLIHLRPLSNDHHVWEQIANGELLRIAPWVATPRDYFEQLPTYERQRLKVIAAGKSVHKAIMIGKSAARLWGLWVLPPFDEKIEMARQSKSLPVKTKIPADYDYRKTHLPDNMISKQLGTRCTTVARACIDIARHHSFEEGLVAMDSALAKELTTKEELRRTLIAMGRVHGAPQARKAIEHAIAHSESPFESYFRGIAIAEKLGEKVVAQYFIPPNFRADTCIDDAVVIEIDGAVKYDGSSFGKSAEQTIVEERRREKLIQNRGFIVLRYSPRELLTERARVVREVRQALEAAQQRGWSQSTGPFTSKKAG